MSTVVENAAGFAQLGLAEPILRAIVDAGYTTPTPIQLQAIPQVLTGGDLLAGAQTGTGKTAGFTLPLLHLLQGRPAKNKAGQPRCLILTPTRELAAQVEESVQTYGKYLPLKSMVMFGGVGINPQVAQLKKPLDILVATPGRLLDHANQKTVDLSAVEILVLDEADRMLDMGFIRDIKRVLALLPKQRQNLLFSATFSDEIKALADGLLHNPGFVEVARRNTASELVEQTVHLVRQSHKRDMVSHLIKQNNWQQVLIFTRTKHGANRLADKLVKDGIPAAAIHGNKSQSARTKALAQFKDGSLPVLVATDIAARGLDIDQLPQVVNFELPNVAEDYVHRIGRTGRAGSSGAAVSLVDEEEIKLLKGIERLIKREIPRVEVEGFVPSPVDKSAASEEREPRAPRPRQGQGQPRQGQPRQNPARQSQPRDSQASPSQPRQARENPARPGGQPRQGKPAAANANGSRNGAQPQGQRRPQSGKANGANGAAQGNRKPQDAAAAGKPLSEAARHQALPQTPIFAPKPGPRHMPKGPRNGSGGGGGRGR
ncbi:DEAD/DEAH box helicase [Methylovorus menthalis]|uniref:DEAD/DEAH box helicase n=1 Tax=Methylovorus menthalis TaxID=1002227 RepID=UPI001E3D9DD7|nr:DEAD/DEAH box helicase [Methylovorus menthalis]MCB4811981.1 DEAD/DEAH box helicase [Methylovorus menthalis]